MIPGLRILRFYLRIICMIRMIRTKQFAGDRTDNAKTSRLSPFVNMQGLSIDVKDVRLTRIGLALNVFPPKQIMHANQVLREGLDRKFEFALPQSDPKYRDNMGSALTAW